MSQTRRNFLLSVGLAGGALSLEGWQQPNGGGIGVGSGKGVAQDGGQGAAAKIVKPPALAPDLVKEFVVAAHGDLTKTQSLLTETPGLLNATWDWGGGDFEKAIGGAGHMGRPDIANFLISQGAHFDIFVAAMLGRLDIVKAALTAYPNLAASKGPHGIPLLVHAQKGGENALAVVDFLKSFKG